MWQWRPNRSVSFCVQNVHHSQVRGEVAESPPGYVSMELRYADVSGCTRFYNVSSALIDEDSYGFRPVVFGYC